MNSTMNTVTTVSELPHTPLSASTLHHAPDGASTSTVTSIEIRSAFTTFKENWRIMLQRVNTEDYPDYITCPRVYEVPGIVLSEYHVVRGVRISTIAGYLASVVYFYAYHRPRLPYADRPLAKLHHSFFPTAAVTTPAGVVGGAGCGAWWEAQRVTPDAMAAAAFTEQQHAAVALSQYTAKRQAAKAQLERSQSLWSCCLVRLGLRSDPVQLRLRLLGFPLQQPTWEDFVEKDTPTWIARRSCVHDARWYKDYTGPVEASSSQLEVKAATAGGSNLGTSKKGTEGKNKQTQGVAHKVSNGAATSIVSTRHAPSSSPPAAALFTKSQMDVVVSDVMKKRNSKEEDRWVRTAGRFGFYGMVTMVVAWNSGKLFVRLNMGFGAGVVCGAILSATRLDEMFVHVKPL